ncbi:transcription elongation factor S-II [Strigomonas culicis]|uniref:Transcription elongation factor S-II n=1 Tax=Strigomonas culicis TaxID=28005 RepID=S9W2V8_9TRYP|nr:transcription elongation factor S-II [Strigomonas culicis]EPY34190.1 transcription elongation factor S-II [Strigomonas culicis]|eukprot:EPY33661.1 transcription elongation factor S-II [Strigomonas culicis]
MAQSRQEKWTQLLLRAFMQDCEESESALRRELCAHIVTCLPTESHEAKDTFLMLLLNLKDEKNKELRSNIVSGKLPVEVLVTLGEQDLVNPERRQELQKGFEERAKDTDLTEIAKARQTSSTLFRCPACKKSDCSFYEKQTRSADEPMTVFCSCNKCGNNWRR